MTLLGSRVVSASAARVRTGPKSAVCVVWVVCVLSFVFVVMTATLWSRSTGFGKPSAALGIAAIFEDRDRFAGRHVVTIVCGSNVDVDSYRRWIGAASTHRT